MELLIDLCLSFVIEGQWDKAQHLVYDELPEYPNYFVINIVREIRDKVTSTFPDTQLVTPVFILILFFVQADLRGAERIQDSGQPTTLHLYSSSLETYYGKQPGGSLVWAPLQVY